MVRPRVQETFTPTSGIPAVGNEDVVSPGGAAWQAVRASDLRRPPFAAIGRLELYDRGGLLGSGTAWLVGRSTAVTAAHNFRPPAGGAIKKVRLVLPGLRADVEIKDARLHPDYRGKDVLADPWDVAAIRFDPLEAPALSLGAAPASGVFPVQVAGFPSGQEAMVVHGAKAYRASARLLLHKVDTSGGQSGAPLLQAGGSAVGVHVGGFASNPMPRYYPSNTALPITQELAAFIQTHVNQWG